MIKIGITGGIGSGKSHICQVFSRLGVPVFYADTAARWLCETDREIKYRLIYLLGDDIYDGSKLNRPLMTDLLFNNRSLLEKVNQIIHPRVAAYFLDWCANFSGSPYVIEESAILFESNVHANFDKIITVTAPEELRIKRVLSRNTMPVEKIRSIMHNQLPEQEKILRSHHVIVNDNAKLVIPQVLQLHKMFAKPA